MDPVAWIESYGLAMAGYATIHRWSLRQIPHYDDGRVDPAKCTFGVPAGNLLRYITSERGIVANPEKINVIMSLQKPSSISGVQKLTDCSASLSRFIIRISEKVIPLYQLLKKTSKFEWDSEADTTLEAL